MGEGASGWLWFAIDVGLVAVFGAVLFYGMTRHRRRRLDPLRDQKTRELYRQEDRESAR